MKKLPLSIEQEIVIKSLEADKSPHHAKTIVIGAKHGEYIIIEEPIIRISDNLISIVEKVVYCWFIKDGIKYSFETVILKKLDDGLTFLEYPKYFSEDRLRKFIRIRVNLEAKFRINDDKDYHEGSIFDISQGGCLLHTRGLVIVPEKAKLTLTFVLPNDQIIKDIEGIACNVTYNRMKQTTEVGIRFTGPGSEIKKLARFCYMCQFFKV